MKRFCVGDAQQLVQTAMALGCGDRYLAPGELEAAGSIRYLDQVLGENELMHEIIAEARARSGPRGET